MTPAALRAARETLGLTQAELAAMLGLGAQPRLSHMENGGTITEPTRRLVQAYLDGYRPADWPGGVGHPAANPLTDNGPKQSQGVPSHRVKSGT